MKIGFDTVIGEIPRLSPRELPDNAAQLAINCKLQGGDLEPWRQYVLVKALANSGTVRTIYKLNDKWLSFENQVDIARGLIPGDNTYRTYLTAPDLYSTPRWTDYNLATIGVEPFPVQTRPVGVPNPIEAPTLEPGVDPNPTEFSVHPPIDEGDQLATSWQVSPPFAEASFHSTVLQTGIGTVGNPAPSYELAWRDFGDVAGQGTWMKRNFGIATATAVTITFDFMVNAVAGRSRIWVGVQRNEAGEGVSVQVDQASAGVWYLSIGTGSAWTQGQYQATLSTSPAFATLAANTFFRLKVDMLTGLDANTKVTATVLTTADVPLQSLTATLATLRGDWCGFGSGFDQLGSISLAYIDNIDVIGTGSTGYNPLQFATSYVYTFENDIGEESAPSPVSSEILRPDGIMVTVTTPTAAPIGTDPAYAITNKIIYRIATGTGGSVYEMVARIPLAQATYEDTKADKDIGPKVLESDDWDLPPATLQNIKTLPNGIMCGFFLNQFCLSVQDRPHAWRVSDRKTTDTDIVAIENLDTTVVIGTKSHVYTATGTDPSNYSMSKPGEALSCSSKLSMVYLDGVGVVFACPIGVARCAGSAGQVDNLTKGLFKKEQWQAFNPSSMVFAVHEGRLFIFYDTGTTKGGLILDLTAPEIGLTRLGAYALAVHVDPVANSLNLVLTSVMEPTDSLLPFGSSAPSVNGKTIYQFDAGTSNMVFKWRGKLNLMPYPVRMMIAQVKALDFMNLVFKLYADGVLIYQKAIGSEKEFVLPRGNAKTSYEIEIFGTSTLRTSQVAEDVMELT